MFQNMEIYKQIFLIFAILVVHIACEETSEKYEETKLELAEESFALDGNSSYPEPEISDKKFHNVGKRSLELDLGHKETTEDSKDLSESENFTEATNSASLESDLSTVESQFKSLNFVKEKDETVLNAKHQLRGLKNYRDVKEKISNHEKNIDFLNDEQENPANLNIKRKVKKEPKTTSKPTLDSMSMEHLAVFKDGEKEPYKVVDVTKYFAAFRDMGVDPAYLRQGNSEVMGKIHEIRTKFLFLIERDVKYNVFPFLFYQTVAPVIKENIFPHLFKPNVMKVVQQLAKRYEIKRLLNMLLDLADLPEDEIENDISSLLKLSKFFSSAKVKVNDNNKKLASLYEKYLKDLQEIIDKDWQEYNAPSDFINYILIFSKEEPFIERTEMLLKNIKVQKEKKLIRNNGEFSKGEDSQIKNWYEWAMDIFGFGEPKEEL